MKTTFVLGWMVLVIAVGCSDRETAQAPEVGVASSVATGTVTVDFIVDDKLQSIEIDGVVEGTTVEALMRRIEDPPVQINGSSTTAFVHSIGDVATAGREGWTFKIDGEFSHEGVGTAKLQPPTTLSWRYGDFSPTSQ